MEIFTVTEVARYLNCSVSAIRNLVRNHQIPFFRIGTKLNFSKISIDDWIKDQELNNTENEDK